MGFLDWLKGVTFIEVIEWTDDSGNTLVYRFPTYDKMIKWGAQLTVRETQVGVFVSEGKVADVFQPGRYTLSTKNLPILVGLMGLPFGAQTPFKSEVYFISLREITNLNWGTPNPIMMNTQDFGPVRIRAFGKYSIKVADPMKLLKSIVGTSGHFTVEGIMEQLRAEIVQKFADQLAERKMPVMDMASQYVELSKLIGDQMRADFVEQYGLSLTRMVIENITLPEEVEKALDERGKMAALGNLDQYTKMKTAEAIGDAAKNPGGLAGAGAGLGAGIVMAQQMQQAMNAPTPPAPSATVNCPSCGKASSTGNFCQHCGKPLAASAMCKACQKAVPSGSKFCPDCGAKIV